PSLRGIPSLRGTKQSDHKIALYLAMTLCFMLLLNNLTRAQDTISIGQAFEKGKLSGSIRNFTMATDNQKGLSDGFANGLALSLRYETAKFHGFQLAIGGASIANLYASDLAKNDPASGQPNRYEIGLFDLMDPAKKYGLNRLEELHVKYNFKGGDIKLGRQFINTTFINPQDGRLRPTAMEGVLTTLKVGKNLTIKGGLIWKIAPRSTVDFYSPGDSFGLYPTGVNPDGTKAAYKGSTKSKTIAVVEVQSMLAKTISLSFSNVLTANVFNTSLIQLDKVVGKLFFGLQAIKQFKVNDGGNEDQELTYFGENHTGFTFGGRAGVKNKIGGMSINYNRITAQSKYLFPREWGKDPFFTFLPRERNEGFGDAHAFAVKLDRTFFKDKLIANIAAGYYHLPDAKNYRLNKYGMPSYTQVNVDLKYNLKPVDLAFLYAMKLNEGETYNNQKFVINKVNMTNYNFIINYHF
ncbi:MAG TPA: hypothetical protein VL088_05680, partial [Pedobacter sp.]|nr:hypothetical protein [Pedobacter sp.]